MPSVHDPEFRSFLVRRLTSLRPDSSRKWGKMSVDQMLWHINEALRSALGELSLEELKPPLPAPIMRWLVLNIPWPKGAPAHPGFIAGSRYDFETERTRALALLDRVASQPITGEWPRSPILGTMSGDQWSRLQAKHVDHHLKQFGA